VNYGLEILSFQSRNIVANRHALSMPSSKTRDDYTRRLYDIFWFRSIHAKENRTKLFPTSSRTKPDDFFNKSAVTSDLYFMTRKVQCRVWIGAYLIPLEQRWKNKINLSFLIFFYVCVDQLSISLINFCRIKCESLVFSYVHSN
jgi:hypothetical protein